MKSKTKKKVAAGVGVGLILAAAAASAYFLTGKRGAKNRKLVKGWAFKVKKDALLAVKKLKKIDRTQYNAALEAIAKRYRKAKNVDVKELEKTIQNLKAQWTHIAKNALSKRTVPKKKNKARK